MNDLRILDGLREIAGDYDALLCDAWGVIHNGRRVFDGVEEALSAFRRERGPVVIITNAPKPSAIIPGQLDYLGLSRSAYDAIVTSGDVTIAEIERRLPAPAFRIGWASDNALYQSLDIEFAPIEHADFIICTGLFEGGPDEPEEYADILRPAAERGVDMICANPDIVVRWNGELAWCAGAIARVYDSLGGRVVYAGKPYSPIYGLAMKQADISAGYPVPVGKVLAIGDGPATDIRGANLNNLDGLFIAHDEGVHDGGASAEAISHALQEAKVSAVAAMRSLRW